MQLMRQSLGGPDRVPSSLGNRMRQLGLCLLLLSCAPAVQAPATAKDTIPFKPDAWFTALRHQYRAEFVQVQVGKAKEGPVVKAVFDDSVAAALPIERQAAAAREVATYIVTHAAPDPKLELVIVGWRGKVDGVPVAQTFRFLRGELITQPPEATAQ